MVRTFISIPVSNATGLSTFYRELSEVRGVSVSPVYQLHLTLAFVGDVPEDRLAEVYGIADRAASGRTAGRIRIRGVGCFPSIKRPRVVWAGVESDIDLNGIASDLRRGLQEARLPFDGKPFAPHITVGRVKGGPGLRILVNKYRTEEFASVKCRDIRVMGSELSPEGAKHSILHVSYLERPCGGRRPFPSPEGGRKCSASVPEERFLEIDEDGLYRTADEPHEE